ncbi:AAA family ATPase [Methylobacterium aquaticum]|uniref:AAA family ATPase n=1 Tax=Methylobacterium aquaticum TaxID=270351 RepID=UPI003D17FCD7
MNMHATAVKSDDSDSPAILKNVANMLILIETVRQRPELSSGFGMFYGPSGYGKSVAATYAQNREGCIYLQVREYWTRKDFYTKFLQELGHKKPRGTNSQMMEEIIFTLGSGSGQAVIIDEADKLVDKKMIELVRDIQETTGVPVILVGEEQLDQKLRRYERVHGRVLDSKKALPCDAEDALELAAKIAPGVEIADDLLHHILTETAGSTRRVANTLYAVFNIARRGNLPVVSLAAYRQAVA